MLVVVHRRPPIVTSRSQGFFFFRGNIRLLLAETVQWTEKERERETEREIFIENLVEFWFRRWCGIDEWTWFLLEKNDFRRPIESGVNRWKGFSCSPLIGSLRRKSWKYCFKASDISSRRKEREDCTRVIVNSVLRIISNVSFLCIIELRRTQKQLYPYFIIRHTLFTLSLPV